tara:strand:+ start:1330 stop:1662 length:333 start_codon:yes stop_codon:yes gene_type:complete
MFFKINSSTLAKFNSKPAFKSKHIRVYVAPSSSLHPRLGIQITKKAVNLSVIRNLVRRKIREDFKSNQLILPVSDYLVIISLKITSVKHEISDILMQEWKQSIKSLSKSQ